jgi:exo-1,4-beta-D-glucosaminidase
MFEAYSRNKYTSTGVIQWMLNNAWPGIIWHLYDYYLNPAGGYFGTKKANEPLHVMYGYDDRGVYVVNSTYQPVKGLKARATVLNFDATPKFTRDASIDLPEDGVVKAFELPEIAGLSTTYFLRLELFDGTKKVGENFYWLSTKPDIFDWEKSSYYHTPMKQHADLTMLNTLPKVDVIVTPGPTRAAGSSVTAGNPQQVTSAKIKNSSKSIAFMVRVRLLKGPGPKTPKDAARQGNATSLDPMATGGDDVLPVLWSDNYFTLLPGEEREISVTYATADLGGAKPVIGAEGWNVVPATTK